MINSVSNVLSFNDSNISANNNNTIYNLYDDNNSFAKMLDEAKNSEEIYSQSVTNKSIEKEEDYQDSLYKNNMIDENSQNADNTENIKKESIENNTADEVKNSELEESVNEKKAEASEKNIEDNKVDKNDNKENIDNNEIKKDLISSKEKAKKLIDKAELIIENYKADKKAQIDKNIDNKTLNEEKLSSLLKDIEDIKEELKNINLEELDEKDKKEITDLIIALESLEEIAVSHQNDNVNIEKLSEIFELVEDNNKDNIKENTIIEDKKNNIEKADVQDVKDIKIKETNDGEMINNSTETLINSDDNVADKREMRLQEAKENANNNNLNNTISDEKGSELTIINMKDSSSSLKGYNHYNNVSKTQNTSNIAESMIRFQDLMSKLVEKAQIAVNNGKSEVLMSLNPEYLGKVRLKISMDTDNNLVGKIFVDNAEIKDIFTKNLDTVISSLNEIGINIEGFDVMLRQDMPNENGEFEFGGNNNNLNGFGADNIEEDVVSVQNYNIVPERKLNLLI